MSKDDKPADTDFSDRRDLARRRIDELDPALRGDPAGDRGAFFDRVYGGAEGDAAGVPWADLSPKPHLTRWLAGRGSGSGKAVDIACGLGDNALALRTAGYDVTAFDLSAKAIEWAKSRFPNSGIDWRVADLLDPPRDWIGAFDLVWECYTIQAVPPERHGEFARAVAALVAPGGSLLVYARHRDPDLFVGGPPWPLTDAEIDIFDDLGLERQSAEHFCVERGDRRIPHRFDVWTRAA